MTCYKPLIRVEDLQKWEKAKDGHLYHPAKIFSSDRLELYDKENKLADKKWGNYQIIPCKECIGCRLDYSREWANRGYLEASCWNQNYFVTLTYDDEHLPYEEEITTSEGITFTELDGIEWQGTLNEKHMTQFMKNLRQIMKREFNKDGIRFMGCGEYGGSITRRPHLHLIIFNLELPTESFYAPHVTWRKDVTYKNKIIERAWGKGMVDIGEANWNSIAYVARYITKKINGVESEEFYACLGEHKEFFRASNRPGIGGYYYEKNKKEIYENDKILIKNFKGSHWITPPKYFDILFEKEEPEKFELIKRKRKKQMLDNLILKSQTTSLNRWEQFAVEQRSKEESIKALPRNKIVDIG